MIRFAPGAAGPGAGPRGSESGDSDGFLVGPENQVVTAVAQAIGDFAETGLTGDSAPPAWLNPLVIVGPPGSGKSHLARGFTSLVARAAAGRSDVASSTAADFASQYAAAIEEDSLSALREHVRNARMWVVEDLGRLPQRRTIQTEFLHTLDELVRGGGLVIVTASRPPQQLTNLSAAIRSRLEEGFVLNLFPPSSPVRQELLRRAAVQQGVPLDPLEAEELAERLPATPRQLLGGIQQKKLAALAETPAPPLRRRAASANVSPADVLAVTARYFGLTQAALRSASRKRSIVHARSVAMYLARELAGETLQEIGAALGGRDHTTVLHACRKVAQAAARLPAVQDELADLRRLLLAI